MQNNTETSTGTTPVNPTIHNLEKPNDTINQTLAMAQVYIIAALTANTLRPTPSKDELKKKEKIASGIKNICEMISAVKSLSSE